MFAFGPPREIRAPSGTTDDSFVGCMTMSWELDIWAASVVRTRRHAPCGSPPKMRGVAYGSHWSGDLAYFQLLALEVVG